MLQYDVYERKIPQVVNSYRKNCDITPPLHFFTIPSKTLSSLAAAVALNMLIFCEGQLNDQRDWDFARQYNLPVKNIIRNIDGSKPTISGIIPEGILYNSGEFNGLRSLEASKIITDILVARGIGETKVNYRLRDWVISRQRYWGTPIPMMTLEDGTVVPTPVDQLPVILPEYLLINSISNPLKDDHLWMKTNYNNNIATRETDTFDTFMESSWYYARYTCPNYDQGMLDTTAANYWLPIDQYIGGIEHAIMHLMYFRFYHKLLRDAGMLTSDEPTIRILCQGMVLADSFYYISCTTGERIWVSPINVRVQRDEKGNIINAIDLQGHHLVYAGTIKMSKSKNNSIDPLTMVEKYGADTIRLFIMFASPVTMALEWRESGVEGANRFLKRLWKLTYDHIQRGKVIKLDLAAMSNDNKILRRELHQTIAKVTDDISRRYAFNTAIAALMEITNKLMHASYHSQQDRAIVQEALLAVVRMLYPFTPHLCFKLWQALNGEGDIDNAPWPIVDQLALVEDTNLIVIQINGRFRSKIIVPVSADKALIIERASKEKLVAKYLEGTKVQKIIYVPGKLLNLVLK
ncbi:hypothetical protein J6590_083993 [Homalodisca vitripennis]|nr:hypothetical protein J6590_083993 [Homalodisca vitripennis]